MTIAQAIPYSDWQFWVVTAIVIALVLAACRHTIPGLRRKKTTRVNLTINRDKHDHHADQ